MALERMVASSAGTVDSSAGAPHHSRPMRPLPTLLGLALVSILPACVMHSHATEFHGVDGVRGVPIEYQTTTVYGISALFVFPLYGDTSKTNVISEFSREAAARGSERVRITQTSSSTYWWVFPPISFFIHPVSTTVEGDIETDALPE